MLLYNGGNNFMNKHAYLVMAHNNWEILKKLITLLDDKRNDIYLHIDAKAKNIPIEIVDWVKQSSISIIDSQNIYWADFSQVEVTLKLLEHAYQNGQYSYFHLLSGTDLPIKSKHEIYHFFESNVGKNFIGIVPKEVWYSVRRVKFYHLLLHNQIYRNSKALKGIDRILEYIQRICGINRLKNCDWRIIDGWTWFSITEEFCKYVLEKKALIYQMFSNTIASDELFMQTLIYNSPFVDTLYDATNLKNGSMRYIDWQRGKPYIWGSDEKDFDLLMENPYMFARKFDESQNEIVEKIYEEISRRNKNDKQTVSVENQTPWNRDDSYLSW